MKITVLGTGTSTGIPVPGCNCAVCLSNSPKNTRLRCSIYIRLFQSDIPGNNSGSAQDQLLGTILIDSSPDLRQQALRAGIVDVRAVLYTHDHADHTHGIDDLRVFNFLNKARLPVYAAEPTASEIEEKFSYVFTENPGYQGGAPAKLDLKRITAGQAFDLFGVKILPVEVLHGSNKIIGFRINNFAYLTDCSAIPEESLKLLQGIDYLLIDGLRYRPHPTHLSIRQAIQEIEKIAPKKSWLTHISHDVDHEEANKKLEQLSSRDITLAWDGMIIDC